MSGPHYYVSTDEFGVERMIGDPVKWPIPTADGPSVPLTRPDGQSIVLRTPFALLDTLDEAVWSVEALNPVEETKKAGTVETHSARLIARTAWDAPTAAHFALDCAEHAIGQTAADVELPNGRRIAEVLVDARRFLDSATDPGEHLGLLARLGTIRRLRRESRLVGDLAFGLSIEDINEELDTTLDASWTSAASVADSLFSALEALRHLAFPRYVGARENVTVDQETHGDVGFPPSIFTTPWGPFSFGGEHDSPYLPAAVAAREAAFRAREAVRDRAGEAADTAETAEREWQADRLSAALT